MENTKQHIDQVTYLDFNTPATRRVSQVNKKTKILIAEDDPAIARQICYQLEKLGYIILSVVVSGEQMVSEISRYNPDILLMDIQLAGELDGVKTAEMINNHHHLPIIFLTANTDTETFLRAQNTNPLGYLTKPVNSNDLHHTIEIALRKHAAHLWVQTKSNWLETTLNSIGDGVVSLDGKGVVQFINPTACELLNVQRSIIIGERFADLFNLVTSNNGDNSMSISQLPPDRYFNCLVTGVDSDFSLPVDCTLARLNSNDGRNPESVLIFTDISARLKADRRRVALESQLRQAQKMESLGQMVGRIAHEFRNIIAGISSYLELSFSQLEENHAQLPYKTTILRKLDQAGQLTKQMLSFGRKNDIQLKPIPLNTICGEIVKFLRHTIRREIQFEMSFNTDNDILYVNRNAFDQIITNLFLNASDAISGKGLIKLQTDCLLNDGKSDNYLPAIPEGELLVITITDDGCGMESENADRIFEPFFTTKKNDNGTGLGLAIVYGLVNQMGGKITCESTVGVGTKFKIYFPATPPYVI